MQLSFFRVFVLFGIISQSVAFSTHFAAGNNSLDVVEQNITSSILAVKSKLQIINSTITLSYHSNNTVSQAQLIDIVTFNLENIATVLDGTSQLASSLITSLPTTLGPSEITTFTQTLQDTQALVASLLSGYDSAEGELSPLAKAAVQEGSELVAIASENLADILLEIVTNFQEDPPNSGLSNMQDVAFLLEETAEEFVVSAEDHHNT